MSITNVQGHLLHMNKGRKAPRGRGSAPSLTLHPSSSGVTKQTAHPSLPWSQAIFVKDTVITLHAAAQAAASRLSWSTFAGRGPLLQLVFLGWLLPVSDGWDGQSFPSAAQFSHCSPCRGAGEGRGEACRQQPGQSLTSVLMTEGGSGCCFAASSCRGNHDNL